MWEGVAAAGGGVGEGEMDEEDVLDGASFDCADLTTLAAAPAAPMNISKGFDVVVAACPATIPMFDSTMADKKSHRCCMLEISMMSIDEKADFEVNEASKPSIAQRCSVELTAP